MLFYDFEVFKEDWLVVLNDVTNRKETVIVNDADELEKFYRQHKKDIWVGYNSRNYDQYILQAILCGFNPKEVNDFIIVEGYKGWQFSTLLKKFPVINYDVILNGDAGLKALEGFMGNNIKETSVPFDIDRKLTQEEIEETIKYCKHDVGQTIEVFIHRKEEFESIFSLVKAFNLPLSNVCKTKTQLSALILGAVKQKHDDEFEIELPPTLKVEKYRNIVNWYLNPVNRDYNKVLETEVAGVPHTFAWGGLHGAITQYAGEGYYINVDVASYYPSLMIVYSWLSRNVADPSKFKEIYNTRLKLKAEKNPMQQPYKIVLNSTYGGMKDAMSTLFDPRQANNVCVGGQLLLLDLIEKLEPYAEIIQSNTDGILIKMPNGKDEEEWFNLVDDICYEWESRTKMNLEFDEIRKVYQKDVNNYVIVMANGKVKTKGAYVKKLSPLDYDLPILNKAVNDYFIKGIRPEETINSCTSLKDFQKICKVSSKYLYGLYNPVIEEKKIKDDGKTKTIKVFSGGIREQEKCFRVFASTRDSDGGIFKVKNHSKNPEKFANTPDKCFIVNEAVNEMPIPSYLDRGWYIEFAKKRLQDFGVFL